MWGRGLLPSGPGVSERLPYAGLMDDLARQRDLRQLRDELLNSPELRKIPLVGERSGAKAQRMPQRLNLTLTSGPS